MNLFLALLFTSSARAHVPTALDMAIHKAYERPSEVSLLLRQGLHWAPLTASSERKYVHLVDLPSRPTPTMLADLFGDFDQPGRLAIFAHRQPDGVIVFRGHAINSQALAEIRNLIRTDLTLMSYVIELGPDSHFIPRTPNEKLSGFRQREPIGNYELRVIAKPLLKQAVEAFCLDALSG